MIWCHPMSTPQALQADQYEFYPTHCANLPLGWSLTDPFGRTTLAALWPAFACFQLRTGVLVIGVCPLWRYRISNNRYPIKMALREWVNLSVLAEECTDILRWSLGLRKGKSSWLFGLPDMSAGILMQMYYLLMIDLFTITGLPTSPTPNLPVATLLNSNHRFSEVAHWFHFLVFIRYAITS